MARAVSSEGKDVGMTLLKYAGETSIFEGLVPLTTDAEQIVVTASQPEEANFGKAEARIDR